MTKIKSKLGLSWAKLSQSWGLKLEFVLEAGGQSMELNFEIEVKNSCLKLNFEIVV